MGNGKDGVRRSVGLKNVYGVPRVQRKIDVHPEEVYVTREVGKRWLVQTEWVVLFVVYPDVYVLI